MIYREKILKSVKAKQNPDLIVSLALRIRKDMQVNFTTIRRTKERAFLLLKTVSCQQLIKMIYFSGSNTWSKVVIILINKVQKKPHTNPMRGLKELTNHSRVSKSF